MYKYIMSDNLEYDEALKDLSQSIELAIDTETYDIDEYRHLNQHFSDPYTHRVRLIQLATQHNIYVFDLLKLGTSSPRLFDILNQPGRLYIGANIKFDFKMLKVSCGVELKSVWCTQIAAQLIANACGRGSYVSRGFGLKDLLRDILGIVMSKEEQSSNWGAELTQSQLDYAARDVEYLHTLKTALMETLCNPLPPYGSWIPKPGLGMKDVTELEMNLIPVTAGMELTGIKVDKSLLKDIKHAISTGIPQLQHEIAKEINSMYCRVMGVPVGTAGLIPLKGGKGFGKEKVVQDTTVFNAPKRMKEILVKVGIPLDSMQKQELQEVLSAFETKAKQEEASQTLEDELGDDFEDELDVDELEESLASWAEKYTLLDKILKLKIFIKQAGMDYTKFIHPLTGRIHPSFNQLGASTGRYSSSVPNLQQVPKTKIKVKDTKASLRDVFISKEGHVMVGCDFAAQEMRILAYLSGDPKLMAWMNDDRVDVHSEIAFLMFSDLFREKFPDVDFWSANFDRATLKKYAKAIIHPIFLQELREITKKISYGLAYGKTAISFAVDWHLAEQLLKKASKEGKELDPEDAQLMAQKQAEDVITKFFAPFPDMKAYLDKTTKTCMDLRYSVAISGRVRYCNDSNSGKKDKSAAGRQGVNHRIQGYGVDMTKRAMLEVNWVLISHNTELLVPALVGSIHDELLYETPGSYMPTWGSTSLFDLAPYPDNFLPPLNKEGTAWTSLIKSTMEEVATSSMEGLVVGKSSSAVGYSWEH